LIAGAAVGPWGRDGTGSGGSTHGRFPAAIARRARMFEPLGDTEKKSITGRSMKIIWIVLAVVAVILVVISFI
jgi:hypothetical protein